jgi:DnaJ-class molecular chaperone
MIYRLTDKPCKRCHGKGWAQWGSIYGPCNRCGGETGKESVLDIPASLADFVARLATIRGEGEAAKAKLAGLEAKKTAGEKVSVLDIGHERRALEFARRQYKEVLQEQRTFMIRHAARSENN